MQVNSGCHNNIPQTGWLKKPKFIFSYFWSLDVQALCLRRSLFAQAAWSQPDPLPTPRHRNNSDLIPTSVAGCDMGLGPEVLGASPPNAPHESRWWPCGFALLLPAAWSSPALWLPPRDVTLSSSGFSQKHSLKQGFKWSAGKVGEVRQLCMYAHIQIVKENETGTSWQSSG